VHEARGVGLHQLDGAADRVGHVHHVELGVGGEEAGVAAVAHGVVEDVDGVVGRAASGRCRVGDQARVAHAAAVHAETVGVVVAEQLAGDLGDAVERGGPLQGVLGRRVGRRGGAEGGDRTRDEHRAPRLARHLEHVVEGLHVDPPGLLRVALAARREDGGEVEDGVGAVGGDGGGHGAGVEAVDDAARPAGRQLTLRRPEVGGHHRLGATGGTQGGHQLRPDLPGGAGDQDPFHRGTFPGAGSGGVRGRSPALMAVMGAGGF
jgi:hypothetical protein